jgi:DNA-binding response OmpR family regulator
VPKIKKILLVEDGQALGIPLTEHLRSHGYSVEVASADSYAIKMATTWPIDLIILDATRSGRKAMRL